MEVSSAAALRDVEIATRSRRLAEQDSEQARKEQIRAISQALQAGAPVSEIAACCGLTPARIYQLRDTLA